LCGFLDFLDFKFWGFEKIFGKKEMGNKIKFPVPKNHELPGFVGRALLFKLPDN
jgi:hypothetical protein